LLVSLTGTSASASFTAADSGRASTVTGASASTGALASTSGLPPAARTASHVVEHRVGELPSLVGAENGGESGVRLGRVERNDDPHGQPSLS